LQLRSSALVLGWLPKRIVPFWCATPASGMRWPRNKLRAKRPSWHSCPWTGHFVWCCIRLSSFLMSRLYPSSLFGSYCTPVARCVWEGTSLSSLARCTGVTKKGRKFFPVRSRFLLGAFLGARFLRVSPSIFPKKEICPLGNPVSGDRKKKSFP